MYNYKKLYELYIVLLFHIPHTHEVHVKGQNGDVKVKRRSLFQLAKLEEPNMHQVDMELCVTS